MNSWNEIYKKEGRDYRYYDIFEPHEDMEEIADFFQKHRVKKVLDLGCGVGRNFLFLARQGFEMFGIDLAEEGISQLQDALKEQNLRASLAVGNVFERLPYPDSFFDAIVSVQVLQHGTVEEIKKGIAEIERILKPRGFIFVTLCGRYSKGKVRPFLVKTAQKVADRTYIPTMGNETGLTHYIYTKSLVLEHYKNFQRVDIWRDSRDYYCFLGRKHEV